MLYQSFQTYTDLSGPAIQIARATVSLFATRGFGASPSRTINHVLAGAKLMELSAVTHERPPFGITRVISGGREVAVSEQVVHRTPFCSLVRFRKDFDAEQPRVLVVAPISGHFATLLRGTVRTLLADHDVYLTDWHNMRDVPLEAGEFDLDSFVSHVIDCMAAIGPGGHVVAVCQPTVGVLAAVAAMAADRHVAQPRSMTLMAGPIDTRINPTTVNELATSKPIEWFERNLIANVPRRYEGAFRRVYPGFVQLAAFMSMNPDRHRKSFEDLYQYLVDGEMDKAEPIITFYKEYFAMMDLSAALYLETVRAVFQEHLLPRGLFTYKGVPVEPASIRRTALLTVEGEKDDICAVGQTLAAQELCTKVRPYLRQHHVQTGVGHYGVFNGKRWEGRIYPILREFIHSSE